MVKLVNADVIINIAGKGWFKNGLNHREDGGPAIEWVSGIRIWYKNGIRTGFSNKNDEN